MYLLMCERQGVVTSADLAGQQTKWRTPPNRECCAGGRSHFKRKMSRVHRDCDPAYWCEEIPCNSWQEVGGVGSRLHLSHRQRYLAAQRWCRVRGTKEGRQRAQLQEQFTGENEIVLYIAVYDCIGDGNND